MLVGQDGPAAPSMISCGTTMSTNTSMIVSVWGPTLLHLAKMSMVRSCVTSTRYGNMVYQVSKGGIQS